MRRSMLLLLLVAGMMVSMLGGVALAHDDGGGELPRHGHVLLLGMEFEGGEPVGYRKCVDLAGAGRLPLNAHHSTVHQGKAGQALARAGHMVVPTDPLIPGVHNCEDFAAALEAGEL